MLRSSGLAARLVVVAVLAALAAAPATAAPARDPDARDHDDFWGEVVHPNRDQVEAIKNQLREALAITLTDWNPAHRDGVQREAARLGKLARKLDPGDAELVYYLGALADEAGRAALAQRLLTEFSARTPRGPLRAEALMRLGRIALRQGAAAEALAPLRQAVAERSDRRTTTLAAVYLAHALDATGHTSDAIELLAQRVGAASGNWDTEEAIELLALAVLYDRDDQISLTFELVQRAQGALAGAYAERLEAGLIAAPPVPAAELHYYRAFLYETAGFVHEARAEWLNYVRLPTAQAPARARAHLAALDALLRERRPGRSKRP